jgi:hypothetical protein
MAATLSTPTDEAVAAAPPEPDVGFAGAASAQPPPSPAPARSRGVRRLVVFVGKPRRGGVE